jgi:hypothetical protein
MYSFYRHVLKGLWHLSLQTCKFPHLQCTICGCAAQLLEKRFKKCYLAGIEKTFFTSRSVGLMVVHSVFRSGLLVCATAALLPAWAQQSTAQIVAGGPTRMQRCQAEIGDVKGSARTLQLRKCLIDRTEGERLLTRECSRQYRALPTGHKVDKVSFQKQCVVTGLKAGHDALPRRKASAPVVQASGAPGQPTASKPATAKAPATAVANAAPLAASKTVDKPAVKSEGKSVDKPLTKPAPSAIANPATDPGASKP